MASKPKELSNLQRDLLHLALQGPKAKIWLPKASQQSFPTTYAAIVSLQRRGLLDTEPCKDPDILTWKVTKEGRDALKAPPKADKAEKPEPLQVKPAAPPIAAASAGRAKAAPAAAKTPAKTSAKTSAPPPAAKASAPAQGGAGGKVQGKDAAPAVKPARSARPAAAAEAPRERGGKGQKAVPVAGRSAGKKPPAAAARKSGGRGRT